MNEYGKITKKQTVYVYLIQYARCMIQYARCIVLCLLYWCLHVAFLIIFSNIHSHDCERFYLFEERDQ